MNIMKVTTYNLCLLGGHDVETNKVLLTAREHYIAHALLVFIHKDNSYNYSKMLWAYNGMRGWKSGDQERFYQSSAVKPRPSGRGCRGKKS